MFEEEFAYMATFFRLFLPEEYAPPPLPAMGFSLQQNIPADQASNIPQVLTRTSSSQKKGSLRSYGGVV